MRNFWLVFLTAAVVVLSGTSVASGAPPADNNLQTALEKAKSFGKPLFIQYGRENCSNCQALKSYIREGTLNIDNFIYVDLDCDDEKTRKLFKEHFTVSGNILPLVVIADSDGRQRASRSGYGKPEEFKAMIENAKN